MAGPLTRHPNLGLIQIAFFLGPLTFATAAWFFHRDAGLTGAPINPGPVAFAAVVAIVALFGAILLRKMRDGAMDPARKTTLTILAWGLGEAMALAGILSFWLSGVATYMVAGLLFMMVVFLAFPIARANS